MARTKAEPKQEVEEVKETTEETVETTTETETEETKEEEDALLEQAPENIPVEPFTPKNEFLTQANIDDIINEVQEEPIISWKKIGGGSFRLGNRIIKENETFKAKESEIPMGFRDVIIPMDSIPGKVEVRKVAVVYKLVPSKENANLFFVVDSFGKTLNEKALEEKQANDLIKALML